MKLPAHYIAIAFSDGGAYCGGCHRTFKTHDAYAAHLRERTLF